MKYFYLFILLLLLQNIGFSQTKISTVNTGTLTSCNGTLTDSDDNAGNYMDNEDYSVTISPDNAQKVVLDFISFDVEAEPVCANDFLIIYNGPDALSPILGTFCNDNPPPASITSAGSSLHIVWHSDNTNNFAGFEINWTGIISGTINITQPISCNGSSDGELTAVGSWGTAPYTYLWSNTDNTAISSGLSANTYSVTITDANGCEFSLAKVLTEPVALTVAIGLTQSISCNGASDGILTATGSNGTAPYTYLWDDASTQSTAVATGLNAATYTVVATDFRGCTANASYNLTEPVALTGYITSTNISCHDFSDGTASIVVNGGIPPFSYLWSDANAQTSSTCLNLSSGTYFCTITDSRGCSIIISDSLANPPQFEILINLSQALQCSYDSDAILTITEINGMSPFQYIWDDSYHQVTQSADSLSAGTYSVSVTDSKGCFTTNSFTIVPPLDSTVTINPLATYTFSSDDTTSIYLTGNPPGGIFTGAGVMQYNNTFRANVAGVGNWPIIYTYTHPTGCMISATDTVHVINVLGQITGITDSVYYCFGDTNIHIWGIPSPNVNDTGWFVNTAYVQDLGNKHGVFNPTLAGPGLHTITFKYIYNAAVLEVLLKVKVDSVGTPDITGVDTAYCFSSASITANAINQYPPNGYGTWSGLVFNAENTFNATFNISTIGIVQDTIFYEYTAPSNCKKTISFPLVVNPLPLDSLVALDSICKNAESFELHGFNSNVLTDYIKINTIAYNNDTVIVNPSSINVGDNIITYQFHNPVTGCINKWEDTLFVHQIPTLSIQGNENKYCTNSPADTLIGKYSYDAIQYTGGIFSGVGVLSTGYGTGIIDPSSNAIADSLDNETRQYNDTIFLEYTDVNGCTVRTFAPVKIYGLPDIIIEGINPEHSICINSPSSLLSYSMTPYLSGTSFFNIMGNQTNNLQPFTFADTLNSTTFQSYIDVPIQLVFSATNSQCITTVNDTVVIHKLPDVDFIITSNKCISNPISFEGVSTIDSISIWNWDMGDGTIISNDSTPQHIYSSGGYKTIELTLTSKYGCVNAKSADVYFDSIPKAQFTWKNECFGGSVVFVNNSFGDTIDSYLWTFGDNYSSTLSNPEHEYAQTGQYNITLTITTKNSCVDSVTQTALIRPEVGQYPYFENFDTSSGAWSSGSADNKNSWRYGQALSSESPLPFSSPNAWFTSYKPDSAYQNEERSFVISPCFNFTSLKRPMIKMRIFCSLENNYDGAALQYSLDNDSTWITLKVPELEQDGINWYDKTVNNSYPGGGNYGWSGLLSADTLNRWIDVRHDLDILAGEPNVRFRIAFASNNSTILNGFAFDDVWIGERPRKVLFEHFTNANDALSSEGNELFNAWVNQNKIDIVDIQHHTEYPVADQLNLDYPQGASAQSLLYGISIVPYSIMDGNFFRKQTQSWLNPNDNYLAKLRHRRLTDPKFTIDIDLGFTGNTINILTEITALESITDKNLTAHVVVLEKMIEQTGVGTNGETKFRNVVKKMLPDAAGTNISENWNMGDIRSLQYSSSLSNFYNAADSNVVVVVYVQDVITKEVYQVATTDTSCTTFIGTVEANNGKFDFIIAPNPATTNVNLYFNKITEKPYSIQVHNILGQLMADNIAPAYSESYTFSAADFPPGFYHVKINVGDDRFIVKKFIVGR